MHRFGTLVSVLFLSLLCQHVQAQAGVDELFLEVSLNGQATTLIMRFTKHGKHLRSSVSNLRELGLDAAAMGLAEPDEVDLDAVAGLSYQYDVAGQGIAVHVPNTLRQPTMLNGRREREVLPGTASPGMLLNYDLYRQLNGAHTAALHELRYFGPGGVISTNGSAALHGKQKSYLRYDTSWSRSDPVTMQTMQVGDLISTALPWSRGMRMGGIQWRKNFDVRPDILAYPVTMALGTAVVPSSVALYVNGVQQLNTQVPEGPFIVRQITGLNGAGQATIVTRDAQGHSVETSLPLYVDTRLMAEGLNDYGLQLGVLRRDYGVRSFSYASSPVLSGSLRHGFSNSLTLESHAEAGRKLVNLGAGMLWRVGQIGIVNSSVAVSAGEQRGSQASLGYRYVSPRFSIDLQAMRASHDYGDMASAEGAAPPTRNDRFNFNLALPMRQSASVSLVHQAVPMQARARIAALSYSASFKGGVYFTVSSFRDLDRQDVRGLAATLSMSIGGTVGASASGGSVNGMQQRAFNLQHAAGSGEGLGWQAQAGQTGNTQYAQAQIQYAGSAGQVNAIVQRSGDTDTSSVNLRGALVWLDSTLHAARQAGNGFALVSTGVPGLPVRLENRPMGRTDAKGHLLVTDLAPYAVNMISIDASALPPDARLAANHLAVSPQQGTGVVASLPVSRYSAATLILQDDKGVPVQVGIPVALAGSGQRSFVGFDGMVFLDELKAENRLLVGNDSARCEVRFQYRPAPGHLPVLGPFICRPPGVLQ